MQAFPATSERWRISAAGEDPQRSRDGSELFFVSPDAWLNAVRITRSRFLVDTPMGEDALVPLTVVVNWRRVLHDRE